MRSIKNISSLIEKAGRAYLKDTTFLRLQNRIRKMLTPQEFRQIPRQLHIETTSHCNIDCEYCVLRENMPEQTTLKLSEFRLLMPYVRHADAVSLSGMAEPLMNKHIAEFIRCIKSENSQCMVSIDSNATLLTERVCHDLIDAGLDSFAFSMDSNQPSINDKIRRGSSISKIIENIKLLNQIKKSKKTDRPFLTAVTVLQKQNYQQLPDIMETVFELGVKRFGIMGLEPYSESLLGNVLWYPPNTPADLPDVIEESLRVAERRQIYVRFACFSPAAASCSDVNMPKILPDGDVVPCAPLGYERDRFFVVDDNNQIIRKNGKSVRKCFGNIFKEKLSDIWNKKEYILFRRNVLNKNFPEECGPCLIKHKFICVRSDISPEAIVSELRGKLAVDTADNDEKK